MKMKRFYLVNGKKVTATSTMNMTQDDMKKMIIEKVEQLAPGQAQMVKDNIDTLVESGLLKAEGSEKAVYELADDGWVKTLNMESTMKVMQQETTTTVTITRQ
jgi:polyhydroxyalkanoate synthesis regulator phasin